MLSIFHFTQTRFVDVTLKTVTLVYVNLKERDLGIKKNMISFDRDLYREEIYCTSQIWTKTMLNLFFQMFPFDPIKNVRKPNITYLCVRIRGQEMLSDVWKEIKRENWEEKG